MLPPHVIVVENAWLAKIAALKMGSQRVAMVIGRRIYLWGVTKADFLQQSACVKLYIAHVLHFNS